MADDAPLAYTHILWLILLHYKDYLLHFDGISKKFHPIADKAMQQTQAHFTDDFLLGVWIP